MSFKVRVRIATQQGDKYVELDRLNLSYTKLRNETERRTKQQGQWFLKAGSANVSNDQELLAAVIASEGTNGYLNLQLQGGVAPQAYVAPTYQQPAYTAPVYQQPAYTAPQPTYQQPAYQAPAYQAPAYQAPVYAAPTPSYEAPRATSGYGHFTLFEVRGNPSAATDKAQIVPEQRDDSIFFTPTECKTGYMVDVSVAPENDSTSKILFKVSRESGTSIQTIKTGFVFGLEHCRQIGNQIQVIFPN
jgi:hypothetical protein